PHGRMASWHPGGMKGFECHYVDGLRSGPWTEWDTTGRVTRRAYYDDGAPWEGRCYLLDRKAWTAVFRGGEPWAGCVWGDWGHGYEERWYRNGEVVGTLRGGAPWEGSFLVWDWSRKLFFETQYQAGEEAGRAPWDGVLVVWDDAAGGFVERHFRSGGEASPPR
ncbi:toxin-antitoxin system YwqK family antitoxin, partial [Planctomycetota bacterium]